VLRRYHMSRNERAVTLGGQPVGSPHTERG